MPRLYKVTFERVSVTAAQDLFQLNGAAGKLIRPKRIEIKEGTVALATAQMLTFRARFLPSAVTNGSGGSPTPPIKPVDPGDAAASFTAFTNNTTKASSSGSVGIVYEGNEHVYNGFDNIWDEGLCWVGPSEACVFELLQVPSGTIVLSGTATVEEYGG